MLRLLRSPKLLALMAIVTIGASVATPQDDEKKSGPKLPFPRVVGGPSKPKDDSASKPKDTPAKKEEPKEVKKDTPQEEPKKPLTFEPVPIPPTAPKEGPKVEPKAAAPEAPQEEPKKEEPKVDAAAAAKQFAADAGLTGPTGSVTVATQRGDNAWLLTASALVMLMTPGLALFYGGMARKKNVLATMMQSYASLAVVGLYWIAVGYGLAFGPSQIKVSAFGVEDGGIIGWDWKLFFLQGVNPSDYLLGYNIPVLTHVMFQGMFAIITPALISGAVAERIRFWPWTIFMILWVTFVYCPLAHMVWAFDWFYADPLDEALGLGLSPTGLLGKLGALDFAGGTVVHIAAGFAGLACICVLRKRTGYPEHAMHPNSMVLTLIGAALLWFGWFGFNGGSGLNSSDLGSTGFATTQAAAAAAGLSWCLVEWIFKGKPTALGLASGIVAGLVAVTPASGFVHTWGGAMIGALAGVVCYFAVQAKTLLGYDDSLDAFGIHGIGGFLGAVLTGVLCYGVVQSASKDGYFAVKGLPGQITRLQAEAGDLKKEIDAINATEPALKQKSDEAAAKVETAKDTEKADLEKKAAAAKAEHEAVAKKVERRAARIKEIGSVSEDGSAIKKVQDKIDGMQKDGKGAFTQVGIQLTAAAVSAVFAFLVSLVLALLVQVVTLGNFRTSVPDENEGLDQTEHGETGFDFGGLDTFPTASSKEPKAAKVPPGGKRFEVVVEGIENGGLLTAWSQLCQPKEDGKVDPDFKAVYPFVTTVQGNRFRLRGGDPKGLSTHIQKLFTKKLGKPVKVRIEE